MATPAPTRPWLHDRELEDAALAALRERKRLRPTRQRQPKQESA